MAVKASFAQGQIVITKDLQVNFADVGGSEHASKS